MCMFMYVSFAYLEKYQKKLHVCVCVRQRWYTRQICTLPRAQITMLPAKFYTSKTNGST